MADWVVVVDDDITNLRASGTILSRAGMRVTALSSGQALLDCVKKKGAPSLILLDINMPGMDGFETLKKYRELEKESEIPSVPVIFLTAEDDSESESKGFDMGVSDYIRKPINPDILVRRVGNIVKTYGQMLQYEESARIDKLTGFLNKAAATERITELCRRENGCLCTIDLDSFKLVNDLYGHDAGDRVLESFASVLKECLPFRGTFGRIGGDEFMIFCHDMSREAELRSYTEAINKRMLEEARRIMGEQMEIPLGASVGAVFVPENGTVYEELFHLCDKMLYAVKKAGKHGYRLYDPLAVREEEKENGDIDLKMLSQILEERNTPKSAMWIGREAFGDIYRYMIRYMRRYRGTAYKLLITVEFPQEGVSAQEIGAEKREAIMDRVREIVQESLRSSDIMMQIGEKHLFLLLPELNRASLSGVLERIDSSWKKEKESEKIRLKMDAESIYSKDGEDDDEEDPGKE